MEHFLFLRHILNRCSFRDNCVWICYKFFVVIHKLFWIFCGKIDFCINLLNFHKMNIVAIFYSKWDEQNDTKIIQFEHCFELLKPHMYKVLRQNFQYYIFFRFGDLFFGQHNAKFVRSEAAANTNFSSHLAIKNCYIIWPWFMFSFQ